MRALIVYEDSHRSYGEAMVGAVRASRPGLEVALAHYASSKQSWSASIRSWWCPAARTPSKQAAERRGCCSRTIRRSHRRICIDGRHQRLENPGLEEILGIIDETEELVGDRARAQGLLASVLIHSPS